ncbi:MAG: FAD-binding oxidoreductase [Actinomycetota bacterium]
MTRAEPGSYEEAAEVLRAASSAGHSVRPRGGGTRWAWGRPIPPCDVEISTAGLDRIVEHNAGDLTAIVQAGVALSDLQRALAGRGQMLALDPPLAHPGGPEAATVGGIVATADTGPLRHRYGSARDLLLGITVALSDGALVRAGGKVIKNVAGYDLAKLFAGSFGTLGLVLEVAVRLHPRPAGSITVLGRSDDPATLQRAASALAHASLALDAADLAWSGGLGEVLARVSGAGRLKRVAEARRLMEGAGLEGQIEEEDEGAWAAQRAAQRCAEGAIMRVCGLLSETTRALDVARRLGASLVGRAGLGVWWLRLPPGPIDQLAGAIEELRAALAPMPCVVLDAPAAVRERVDVWGGEEDGALALMRRVKARFDPSAILNPGIFVGGI